MNSAKSKESEQQRTPQIQARINAIAHELATGKDRSDILKIFTEWNVSEATLDRYINDAKPLAQQLSIIRNKALEETLIEGAVDSLKKGLKTKHERLMILQKECDNIIMELNAGVTTDYIYNGYGKQKKVVKEMSVNERAYLRRTLKDIQSEISKIEGDYAPTKIDPDGFVLQPITQIEIVHSTQEMKHS